MWFLTGAVMHFVPYPALADAERLGRSSRVDLAQVAIGPSIASKQVPDASAVRLVGILGRPTYILERPGAPVVAIDANTGSVRPMLSPREAAAVAAAFQGSTATSVDGPVHSDQWIVAGQFDPSRPFYRVRFHDPADTILYVSARSGEVLQRTTFKERAWNWCGANVHWIYFSALRANWIAWDRVVWWLALIGLLTSSAGVWLGWVRFAAARRSRRRGLTPFRGWLSWHHRIGLFAGAFVLTWIFSGWLSMDHGRIFSTGEPTSEQVSRLRGMSLPPLSEAVSVSSIRTAGPATEILMGAIAGRTFLVARGGDRPTRIIWPDGRLPESTATIPESLLIAGIHSAWPNLSVLDRGVLPKDNLYSMAEDMPAGIRAFRIGGPKRLDVYVDPVSGRIVTVMDSSRRAYAWAFYALHTFKFPGLSSHPVLRHFAILMPLVLGFAFSVTGIIVAVSRLRKSFDLSPRHR
jgi:hypothetical protein